MQQDTLAKQEKSKRNSNSMQSSAMGSVMSKYTSGAENKAEEKIHRKLLKEAISSKVFFWDDLLPDWGGKEEDGQTDIENLI